MEFLKIANQMREDLKKIVSENNIELFTLISEPKEDNPRFNKMILDMHYKYSTIQINKGELFDKENKETLLSALFHDNNLSFGDRLLNNIIKIYLNQIWGVFVVVKDSKITPNGAECFTLPSPNGKEADDLEINNRYIEKKIGNIYLNKNRQLALFILQDGTCYYAPKDHMGLATWLNMNAIDIKGALRLEINDAHQGIDLSSMGSSQFSKSSNDDTLIEITNEQAQILASIIKSVKLTRKKDVTTEDIYKSYGLGCSMFNFDEEVGIKNIKRIWYEFGDFKRNAFIKQLRDFHENLTSGESGGVE
ncbi:MAG: hypothetical protein J6J23_04380 [Clostridia bacterium]|nr:hypothetical protein [Clostridia bacterium]